jgi:hypothetical protein
MLENTVKRVPTITITVNVTGTVINYGSGSAEAKSYGSYDSAKTVFYTWKIWTMLENTVKRVPTITVTRTGTVR